MCGHGEHFIMCEAMRGHDLHQLSAYCPGWALQTLLYYNRKIKLDRQRIDPRSSIPSIILCSILTAVASAFSSAVPASPSFCRSPSSSSPAWNSTSVMAALRDSSRGGLFTDELFAGLVNTGCVLHATLQHLWPKLKPNQEHLCCSRAMQARRAPLQER